MAEVVKESTDTENESGQALPFKGVIPIVVGPSPAREKGKQPEKYKLKAPIQSLTALSEIVGKVKKAMVEAVTVEELLAVSDQVRDAINEATSKKRVPFKQVNYSEKSHDDAMPYFEEEEPLFLNSDAIMADTLPMVEAFLTQEVTGAVPAGSCVVPDPILQYLESLPADMEPKQIFVGPSSAPLRVVYAAINGQGEVACIIDTGSQIVSMSLAAAKEAKLSWDPSIRIYMESATGSLARSLGLARNVPYKFGEVTIYLQVHVLEKPAYDVLLGRPFDIVTESNVQTSFDGSQILTLKDLNTGKKCSMPTYPRVRETKKGDVAIPKSEPAQDTKPVEDGDFQPSSMN